jgi:hypothetical protein
MSEAGATPDYSTAHSNAFQRDEVDVHETSSSDIDISPTSTRSHLLIATCSRRSEDDLEKLLLSLNLKNHFLE